MRAVAPPAAATEGWSSFSHWKSNGNGSVTRELYTSPAFRRTSAGWSPVDNVVRASGRPGVGAEAAGAVRPVRFGDGSSRLVEIAFDGGPVTLSAAGLQVSTPQVRRDGVSHANVAPATDLTYRLGPTGVKEEVILRSPAAPTSFRFHLADPAHVLGKAAAAGGGYRFANRVDGDVAVGLAPAYAHELRNDGRAAPVDPGSAHLSLVAAGDGFDVVTSVDTAWLLGKRFPVVLDPTVTFTSARGGGAQFAGQLAEDRACPRGSVTAHGGCVAATTGTDLLVGTYTDSSFSVEPSRPVFRYDVSSIPPRSSVTSATFGGYVTGCTGAAVGANPTAGRYLCDKHSYVVDLQTFSQDWDPAYATYDDLDQIRSATAFSSLSQPAFTTLAQCGTSSCFWEDFPVTGQMQQWVNGAPNYGFVAKLRTESFDVGGPAWYLDYDAYGAV